MTKVKSMSLVIPQTVKVLTVLKDAKNWFEAARALAQERFFIDFAWKGCMFSKKNIILPGSV